MKCKIIHSCLKPSTRWLWLSRHFLMVFLWFSYASAASQRHRSSISAPERRCRRCPEAPPTSCARPRATASCDAEGDPRGVHRISVRDFTKTFVYFDHETRVIYGSWPWNLGNLWILTMKPGKFMDFDHETWEIYGFWPFSSYNWL